MTRVQEIEVPGRDRTLDAYLATPNGPKTRQAAIIVIHEIFGLDGHIRDVARRFAENGYVAVAPNLFPPPLARRMTPANIQLALRAFAEAPADLRADPEKFREFVDSQPSERRPLLEAFRLVNQPATQESYAFDLLALARPVRERPDVDPERTGTVGFCIGGSMVARFATVDPELRAAVIFYGHNPPLDQVPRIRAAVLGLYASEDPGITAKVPDLARAMGEAGKRVDHHVYPGARHAFFNDRRPNFHAESARDAWQRTLSFFATERAPG